MNDEPNAVDWKVGDTVIHDADYKAKYMLMRVIKVQKNGLIITEYIDPFVGLSPHHHKPLKHNRWKNEKKFLHNPKRFGIDV